MIEPQVVKKLIAFVVVTVLSVVCMAAFYMQVPAKVGIGVYHVSLKMPLSGGLYPTSQVTYRGAPVGIVEDIQPTRTGAVATLRLNDGTAIPSDSEAQVRSTSAVGEQYLQLVPLKSAGSEMLRDGSVIEASNVSLPTPTTKIMKEVERLMASVKSDDLSMTINELAAAFADNEGELGHLLDATSGFQRQATANLTPTMELLEDASKVLDIQADATEETISSLRHLRKVTHRVVSSSSEVRELLESGPSTLDAVGKLSDGFRRDLPPVLADAATVFHVANVYLPGVEHVLILFPGILSTFQAAVPPQLLQRETPSVALSLAFGVNDPPGCTEGWSQAGQLRDPNDLTPREPRFGEFCDVPHDDPRVVRGARNVPCPTSSDRGPTPAACGTRFPRYAASGRPPQDVVFFEPQTSTARTGAGAEASVDDIALPPNHPTTLDQLGLR